MGIIVMDHENVVTQFQLSNLLLSLVFSLISWTYHADGANKPLKCMSVSSQ